MILETIRRKFGLEKESRPLTGFFFIQKLFYCHPGYGKKFKYTLIIKYLVFHMILGFPCYVGMIGHLLMASSDEIISERLESSADTIQTVVQYLLMLTYIYLGNRFMALFKRLYSDEFGRSEKLHEAFHKCNKIVLVLYFYVCGVAVPSIGIYNYHFNWNCDGRQLLNDKRFVCGLILPAWFPFEVDSEVLQKVLSLWFTLFCMVVVPHCAMSFLGLMSIPWYVTIKIEHLKNQLEEISEVETFQQKFRYFIDYYSEINECVKDMNNTIGYCLVSQFSFVTVMIALLEYNIIISGNIIEILSFLFWLSMEILMCTIGQTLENEHEELVKSICYIPWYNMSPELKKNYSLFLGKVQIPVKLKAQPIVDINNQFLLSVLHGTYSLLMFLLNNTQ